jgi:DNA-binding transcriptional MerR regulator
MSDAATTNGSRAEALRGRAPAKAATAFRTISEVSVELDVPQHVLRFWETKFPQIRPLKRGGGRRYYRPDDVELLRRIQHLLYKEGYTIKGVQRLLRESRGAIPPVPAPGTATRSPSLAGDLFDAEDEPDESDADIADGEEDDESGLIEDELDSESTEIEVAELNSSVHLESRPAPFEDGVVASTPLQAETVSPGDGPVRMDLPAGKRAALEEVLAELLAIRALIQAPPDRT